MHQKQFDPALPMTSSAIDLRSTLEDVEIENLKAETELFRAKAAYYVALTEALTKEK